MKPVKYLIVLLCALFLASCELPEVKSNELLVVVYTRKNFDTPKDEFKKISIEVNALYEFSGGSSNYSSAGTAKYQIIPSSMGDKAPMSQLNVWLYSSKEQVLSLDYDDLTELDKLKDSGAYLYIIITEEDDVDIEYFFSAENIETQN